MEKGPQRKWLHRIKKSDTPDCECHQEQTGRHLVEGCKLLAEARGLVEREEIREWETRHSRNKKKKKGDVGVEKEKEEEEGERLANFFYTNFLSRLFQLLFLFRLIYRPVMPLSLFLLLFLFLVLLFLPCLLSFHHLVTPLFLPSISFLLVLRQNYSYVLWLA